jgi:hypothetical protein
MYSYPYIEEEGNLSLNTSNRGGKKFTTWTFNPVHGKRFDIQIDVLYPDRDNPMRFKASSDHLHGTFENTDIEELRKEVNDYLQQSCAFLNDIEWEEYYEVVVHGDTKKDRGISSDFEISYGKLKRGISPINGAPLTIHNNCVVIDFPEPKKRGTDLADICSYHTSKIDEVSYIPVTERNTAALESLVDRLGKLRDDVSNLLSQDNIQTTLLNVDKKLMLE